MPVKFLARGNTRAFDGAQTPNWTITSQMRLVTHNTMLPLYLLTLCCLFIVKHDLCSPLYVYEEVLNTGHSHEMYRSFWYRLLFMNFNDFGLFSVFLKFTLTYLFVSFYKHMSITDFFVYYCCYIRFIGWCIVSGHCLMSTGGCYCCLKIGLLTVDPNNNNFSFADNLMGICANKASIHKLM